MNPEQTAPRSNPWFRLLVSIARSGVGGRILPGIALFVTVLCLGAPAQAQGLVAAYSLNEGIGSTIHDSSGNNLNGTANTTSWTGGEYLGALAFNGTSSNVDLGSPAAFAITGSMTLEAWAYVGAHSLSDETIVAFSTDTLGWQLKATDNTGSWTFGVSVSDGTHHVQRYSSTVLAVGTWYHVAGVYNATAQTLDIYIDGALADGVLSGVVPASQSLPTGVHTYIGQRGPSCACYFDGTIDEVRVYNTALTLAQIQTDMNTPIGPAAPVLSVTSTSSAAVSLSWTASTYAPGIAYYVVQRCQGAPCTNFATIAPSVTATTYNDTAVTANQTYDYVVYAVGNDTIQGPNSNVKNATAASGTAPPTTPQNVTAIAYGGVAEIRLNWMASTSTAGLAEYVIQRCAGAGCSNFAQIATTAATVYRDTNVAGSSSYSYIVAAVDTTGNVSAYSTPPATATSAAIPTAITFVQGNYATPQGSGVTSVVIPFNNAQKPGDMNVIAVGWGDTVATVMSVTDTSLNTYALAAGPTAGTGVTQAIYYSPNIHQAATNSVTVTFAGGGATFPDVRILEYRGADPNNPVDVTAVGTGTGFSSSTAAVQTTYPTDLLFGANLVSTATVAPGIGFTQRILTAPDADIAEDEMVTAVGSYSADAYLDNAESAGPWVMQMVAFRTQIPSNGAAHPTAPILTGNVIGAHEIDLAWTASTSANGIQNYILQRCRGVGCTNFAAIAAPTGTIYDNTSLFSNTSYSYRVRAIDTQDNSSAWSNTFIASTH